MQIRMLREIDAMFEGAPQSRKTLEVKEEMLQNLMEKYNDLLAEGKSEEAAFNIAIGSVGDISDLLEELKQPIPKVASFPEPDMSGYEDDDMQPREQPAAAQATDYDRHHRASIVAVAVMLLILSPVAVILFGGKFGLILMFGLMAAGVGLIVYNGIANGNKKERRGTGIFEEVQNEDYDDDQPRERRKMTKEQKRFYGSLSSALWLITVALYFVISFATHAWYITWIIFLIAAAINNLLRAFIDLYRR